MFLTLGVGMYRWATGTLGVVTGVEAVEGVVAPLTLFLLLRAFSSGCTALTGIEAISNGITAFKEPRTRNAAITLQWMSGILITIFLSMTVLAHQVGAMPSEVETVFSQVGRVIFGEGSLAYLAVVAATALILLMAANTSYADFPRLAALHAGDGFLPRQLTFRGGRLVFSWGIVTLAVLASLLVIAMDARTTALIPLYAIGVFLSFTVSQSGMVVRMWKIGHMAPGEKVQGLETILEHDPRWKVKLAISAIGALSTGLVMVIFAVTKFTSGAWFVVVLIPLLVAAFFRIHHHYQDVARSLSLRHNSTDIRCRPVQTLVLVDGVHAGTIDLINFARSLGHPWHAVHIGVQPEKAQALPAIWKTVIGEGELVIVPSPYRELNRPIRQYVERLLQENPDGFVHVVVGHLSMESAWEQALHRNSVLISTWPYTAWSASSSPLCRIRSSATTATEPSTRTCSNANICSKTARRVAGSRNAWPTAESDWFCPGEQQLVWVCKAPPGVAARREIRRRLCWGQETGCPQPGRERRSGWRHVFLPRQCRPAR
jgi:hypothetical protein